MRASVWIVGVSLLGCAEHTDGLGSIESEVTRDEIATLNSVGPSVGMRFDVTHPPDPDLPQHLDVGITSMAGLDHKVVFHPPDPDVPPDSGLAAIQMRGWLEAFEIPPDPGLPPDPGKAALYEVKGKNLTVEGKWFPPDPCYPPDPCHP